ncbi:hypothetical protein CesoFtcFv8_009714 [Champsocephalus esox]|uniref:Uncharacterized protein n=1 Tax=Champsocephalus esox TaxID=159716 RepID=A0AAN8GYZ2_9TELE|nr:hypothetical protein CesoFtcFv8_009714 [Champsocephalus esox]
MLSVDFRQRQHSHVDAVLSFVQRYKRLLPVEDPRGQDRISGEFLEYHMLEEADIPDMVWKGAWGVLERKNTSTVWTWCGHM